MATVTISNVEIRKILSAINARSLRTRPVRQDATSMTFDFNELDAELRQIHCSNGGFYMIDDELGMVTRVEYRNSMGIMPAMAAMGVPTIPTHHPVASVIIQKSENVRATRRINASTIIEAARKIYGIEPDEWFVDKIGMWARNNSGDGITNSVNARKILQIVEETGIEFDDYIEGDTPILCPAVDDSVNIFFDINVPRMDRTSTMPDITWMTGFVPGEMPGTGHCLCPPQSARGRQRVIVLRSWC